ncbi:hypothetical protein Clacol_009187 [Clathrus columnatus]|uniref:Uncharacterized protein n=1 Tax=Clathrus columnatus TaxID=1419009 RepID=A0AAV5AMB0_9AGAM|nr:hypothetical protein Clacol_009187 [Clathrus columnatus]
MIRNTSLVLLAISLVAFSSPLLPRTAAEIENDIGKLITDTTIMDVSVNNLSTAGVLGTEDTTQLDGMDGAVILSLIEDLEPIILKTLDGLINNEPLIEAFDTDVKGLTEFIQDELADWSTAMEQFEGAFIDIAPANLKPTASAIASTIGAAFSIASASFATAT